MTILQQQQQQDENSNRKKNNIVLINLNPGYNMEASTVRLAARNTTSSVLQVVITQTEVEITDMIQNNDNDNSQDDDGDDGNDDATNKDDEKEKNNNKKKNNKKKAKSVKPLSGETFEELWNSAYIVLVPDCMFANSQVLHVEGFQQHAIPSLVEYYRKGGHIFVIFVEGILSVGTKLNEYFGTDWHVKFSESPCSVSVTEQGRALLGSYAPETVVFEGKPRLPACNFISCPAGEGLYRLNVASKEEFVRDFHAQDETFERLGIEKDVTMDCFNVEKSWINHVNKYTDRYCVCLHEGKVKEDSTDHQQAQQEGIIVWYGDREQTDTTMAFVFCKLLTLIDSLEAARAAESSMRRRERERQQEKSIISIANLPLPSLAIAMAVAAVLVAVVFKLLGF